MDTQTVLEIIKMIDKQILALETAYENNVGFYDPNDSPMTDDSVCSAQGSLKYLGDHLQQFIEGQLNAAENQTVE